MKYNKLIYIILFMLVFLCACSGPDQAETEQTMDAATETAGFAEMDIEPVYLQNAQSLCIKDDLLVFMTSTYTDKDGNLFMPAGEGDYEESEVTTYIVEYDLQCNKLRKRIELKDCPVTEVWGLELDQDKIVIFSDSEKKNAYYDLDMNYIEETDRIVADQREEAMKSSFYTDRSAARDGFCDYTEMNNDQMIYFYDHPEEVYIFHTDKSYQASVMDPGNGYILCETFGNSGEILNYKVIDYKSAKEMNDASIRAGDYGYDYIASSQTAIGDKYAVSLAFLSNNEDGDDYAYKIFYWNYQNERTNKALDIKRYTELDSFNRKAVEEIADQYHVDIHINDPNEYIVDSTSCEEAPAQVVLYDNLNTIKAFLESLPEGMLSEIYSGYKNKENEKSGIRIDLVSEITIEASAFAKDFVDPMEMCFPFNGVFMTNLAHEFMHLLEARLSDHDDLYYGEWEAFNKGFEHEYNPDEQEHPCYEFSEEQFLTAYSATNDVEERAELFAYLYTGGGSALDNAVLRNKADYLLEIIRRSFPSVRNAQSVCWDN